MKNLLLIDSTVTDYQTFVDSVNTDTIPFVYRSSTTVPFVEIPDDPSNIPIQEPYVHAEATTRQSLLDFLGETTIDRIGIVFTMHANVFLEGDTFFEGSNVHFILTLIQKYLVKNIDYFACNTLQYPEWNEYYAKISETGVVVGASNNKTGNLQYGGDWTMESTNQDVEFIYFTNTIEYYKYLLDTSDTGYSTVVIKDDYTLWGSGSNAKNQLGSLGSGTQNMSYNTFTKLTNVGTIVRVACSVNFTLFLTYEKGAAFWGGNCWVYASGTNADGELGSFGGIQFAPAGPSANGNGYTYAMCAGEFFAMYQDDTPDTRGSGIPAYAYKTYNGAGWIACGRQHSILIRKANLYLYGTGLNGNYQLGTGNTTTLTTYNLLSSNRYVAIACGSYHSMALREDGTIWGSGLNSSNQLSSLYGSNTTFVQISPANKIFVAIACGEIHSLALNIDGTVWGTGSNAYNQLGNLYGSNTTFVRLTPFGTAFRQVSCGSYGSYHSLALDSSGNLWGTGLNATNQLGTTYGSNTTFTQILTNVAVLSNQAPSYIDPIYISYLFSLSANVDVVAGNSLTIYGTNLASVSYVSYGGVQVPSSSFTSISQFTIVFTVPSTGTFVNYVTINVGGVNYPATNSDINKSQGITIIPTIATITQAANGLITMTGTNYTTPAVTMTGGFTSGTVTRVSATQLTFTPSSFIGSSTFTVTDGGNSSSLTVSFPTITNITQSASGLVTINGTTFSTPTVTISGFTPGTVTKVNSTQLTFTPNAMIGSATFTITDSGSSVAYTASFPSITSITQAASGLVTINGTNFVNPTVTMTGGFTSGTVTRVSSSQLAFTPNTFIGSSTFTVTDTGSFFNFTASFPTITSMTQASNGLITLNGTNFNNPTITITGGYTPGTVTKVSSTQLTFTPNTLVGNATFTVTDTGNAATFTVSFFTVTRISQASNGLITVTGTNFISPTVTITGYTSGTVTRVSATQLTFIPNAFIGSATFTVTDAGNTLTYTGSFPNITSFTPALGPRNTTVTITGTNLGAITNVLFGAVAATTPTVTSNTVTVNAPLNTKSVTITLSDANGNSVATSTTFTYSTNSNLFTTSLSDPANKLLTQLSLTDGIGDTGVVNLGSSVTAITFLSPITVGYTYPINASNQIGYTMTATAANTTSTSGGIILLSMTIPAGVWIVTGKCNFAAASTTYSAVSITTLTYYTVSDAIVSNYPTGSAFTTDRNMTGVVTHTSSTTYNFISITGVNIVVSNILMTATRIA